MLLSCMCAATESFGRAAPDAATVGGLAAGGQGAGNIQIARSLRVSEATVAKHLENVFMRLGVQSRTEAVAAVLAFLDAA